MVTPVERLAELPRYLEAARYRLGNLQGKVKRDSELSVLLADFRKRIDRLGVEIGEESPVWLDLRYMLEEVRVGLFAERLGVREKASPKRLDRLLEALEREHGLI
jgi:ATP-dependent helicase HrpA